MTLFQKRESCLKRSKPRIRNITPFHYNRIKHVFTQVPTYYYENKSTFTLSSLIYSNKVSMQTVLFHSIVHNYLERGACLGQGWVDCFVINLRKKYQGAFSVGKKKRKEKIEASIKHTVGSV